VEACYLKEQIPKKVVAHVVAARTLERVGIGLAGDDQRIPLGPDPDDDDLGYAHP
jgi:hypothetical protein